LNSYNGRIDIDLSYIIQKRKERYEEEEILFNNYGYYYLKKDVEPIFRRLNKQCYSEPQKRRSETAGCECEAQTIYHLFNVDELLAVTDTKAMYAKRSDRQHRVVESTTDLVDVTICLTSEINTRIPIEEVHPFIGFRRSYIWSSIKRKFKKTINQRWLKSEDMKYEARAFENNLALWELIPAADSKAMYTKRSGMQRIINECTNDSFCYENILEFGNYSKAFD
jgi:hypothetical protein